MPNLLSHLRKVAEQKPQATYYNVDMIKYQVSINQSIYLSISLFIHPSIHLVYLSVVSIHPSIYLTVLRFCLAQVSADGIQSTPLNLAVSWRGDATNTDLRIDYKYNTEAMAAPVPLHNIQFLVPVDGVIAKLQAMIPPASW